MTDVSLEYQAHIQQLIRRTFPLAVLVRRYIWSLVLFLSVLAFLQWGVPALGIPKFILPTPTDVLDRMLDPESDLLYHFSRTAIEALAGLCVGGLLGFGLAVLFVHVPPIEDAIYPWVIVLQTVPMVAIAPMLIIWLGNGMLPCIAMSALFAFFPILVNTVRGLRQADRATLELLQSYAVSRWQLFWTLRWPNCLPFLFAGLKVSSTLAIIGAIVGEFAGAGQGLGFIIIVSANYALDTSKTFAAVAYASLLGISLYLLLLWLERRIVFWEQRV